ncbi:hypothetical protein [Roseobacter sp. HKCCA0434]|uniref:hypothetical protein n=1 Tax=Roseobacter sp. HKCCA0434 TaxID=3079297 RepID=UPI0029059333|nr:hypothetical protein [Roseobacter sp. HKCCA0434]
MKRRQFVAGAGVAGAALGAAPAVKAQTATTLTIESTYAPGSGRAQTGRDFAERVAMLSGGDITVQIVEAGAQGAELMDRLSGNEVDGVLGSQDDWYSFSPAFSLFAAVPGGMMERELEAWIRSDTGQERWDALAAEYGMKPLYLGDAGGEMLWSSVALTDPSALDGLSVAARGMSAATWRAAGANAPSSADPAPFPTGVEAYETAPLAEQYAARENAPARLYLDTPTRPTSAVSLSLSLPRWEGLTDAQRRVLDYAADAVTFRTNARSMQANALAHQAVRLGGTTVEKLPEPVWTALMDAARETYEALGEQEGEARRAWRAYFRFARDVQNWTRLSEAAFTVARARNVPA